MLEPEDYRIASTLFPRLLGLVYCFAFGPFLFQIKGLIGSEGILPVESYLNLLKTRFGNKAYYYAPSLFWINASNTALMAATVIGTVASLLLFLIGHPLILLPIIYILYFSIVSAGQDFLSFGWELFLLEITANTLFLTWTGIPNPMIWLSLNFLLFRFHLQAGAVKIQSGDPSWSRLTALSYHYQTQPLPNTAAWYVHKLPQWFHKLSCLMMFAIELVVPFGVFMTEEIRLFTFCCFAGLQFFIWLTGNFSYLNYLSIAFSFILVSDRFLEPYFGSVPDSSLPSIPVNTLLYLIGTLLLFLQTVQVAHHFFPNAALEKILRLFYPLHICCRYGIFAVMTTKRYEIVIEGSHDGTEWKEYAFRYKPSEITRRPRRIAPYQPRLDWQAWFLPFTSFEKACWFQNFLARLMQGTPAVLKLLRTNPFPEKPPKYIRAVAYEYVFSDAKSKKEKGNWWERTYAGTYSSTLQLSLD